MEPRTMSWTTQVEAAIRSLLPHVQGVRIAAQGDEIRELHVVTSSPRPAKQVARDIVTLLYAQFDRRVDHRVVSVVRTEANGVTQTQAAASSSNESAGNGGNGHRSAPRVDSRDGGSAHAPVEDRIRFVSVNVFVNGSRAQAQVELRRHGVVRLGNASGFSTRAAAQRLIAAATVSAVQQFLASDVAVGVEDVQVVRVGRRDAVVAALALIAHRHEKSLVGCCGVDQDPQQAVVLATLAALNRVVATVGGSGPDSCSKPASD